MRIGERFFGGILISCIVAVPAFAGFASLEQYLAAVGRVSGASGAEFYTTIWVTDLTGAPVSFTFEFLKAGQANDSPASFTDTLAPGQTKVYENVVQTKLGLSNVLGGARVTSTGEVLVAERIYDQAPGADLGDTEGLFFAGVPKSFSISIGQSASIQGINQGGAENFRYNFALLETGGGSPTVNVQLFDGNGTMLGQKAYAMQPYEQLQPNVKDLFANVATTNGRITATVTGGTGSIIIAGAQLANISQDSSGFEMSFRDSLLGGGGGAGVTSLNALTGAVSLIAGSNVTLTTVGNGIKIDAAASGSGGLTLPYANGASNPTGSAFAITNGATAPTGSFNEAILAVHGAGSGLLGTTVKSSAGMIGDSSDGPGVLGLGKLYGVGALGNLFGVFGVAANPSATIRAGVVGSTEFSVGTPIDRPMGVVGASLDGSGVVGVQGSDVPDLTNLNGGIVGASTNQYGVVGRSTNGYGVGGFTDSGSPPFAAVSGFDSASGTTGALGGADYAVKGTSPHGNAIFGLSNAPSGAGVQGENGPSKTDGYLGGSDYGVFGNGGSGGEGVKGFAKAGASAGVHGQHQDSGGSFAGVEGEDISTGAIGYLGGPDYGVFSHGDIKSDGGKSFVEPHPADPTKEINYVCLEGRESGTYFRGTAHAVGGLATIPVPEDFRAVTSDKGLTVQLTPVGDFASLVVKSIGLDRIVVQSNRDVEFFYMVNGVRRALENHQPVGPNVDFVPRSAADEAYWRTLPAESLRRMKANGTLNEDGSINLETAHRLGWDRRPGWNAPPASADAKR